MAITAPSTARARARLHRGHDAQRGRQQQRRRHGGAQSVSHGQRAVVLAGILDSSITPEATDSFTAGMNPSVALNNNSQFLEVHHSGDPDHTGLFYSFGSIDRSSFQLQFAKTG